MGMVEALPDLQQSSLEFGGQQAAAIKAVEAWLKDPYGKQVFRIFGFAGTGKTTIATELARLVKGTVLFATFTGKAALVLRKKGCTGASTIHSLIFTFEQNATTGEVTYKLNPDSDLAEAALLIVDEVSMVDDELGPHLESFGRRILVLGDPMQLKPIRGQGYFTNGEPDVMLTEIHRQAAENPIIRMSMDIREGGRLKPGSYGDSLVIRREDITREQLAEKVLESDQLICGLNRTRTSFNGRIRTMKGLQGWAEPWHPTKGDRLICLKNNRPTQIFNGSMWEATKVSRKVGVFNITVNSLDDNRAAFRAKVFEEFFNGTDGELDWREKRKSLEFTYGWAITCHKAQGSQYDNPIIFDESGCFRDEWVNWLYTATTRAAERVTVIV
jgi:exodeoxyribonuclease-5